MNMLERLYASSGSEVIFNTLQITIKGRNFWLVEAFDDVVITTESGVTVTCKATAMQVGLPSRNEDGTQDLQFAIADIEGEVSSLIRDELDNLNGAMLTFRRYESTNLSVPAAPPMTLPIKGGYWKYSAVHIKAGFMNILDMAWPRFRYILSLFPGLRYIA